VDSRRQTNVVQRLRDRFSHPTHLSCTGTKTLCRRTTAGWIGACERQPLRPGEERTSPRDVVFVGCDPGMNKPLSLVAVFPQTTKEQPNKVATYSWQHYATSARKLSAATRPKQRAEENRRRQNEAVKSANSEDPASKSNAIAMAKSARDGRWRKDASVCPQRASVRH
jgi:hypothetical protein